MLPRSRILHNVVVVSITHRLSPWGILMPSDLAGHRCEARLVFLDLQGAQLAGIRVCAAILGVADLWGFLMLCSLIGCLY